MGNKENVLHAMLHGLGSRAGAPAVLASFIRHKNGICMLSGIIVLLFGVQQSQCHRSVACTAALISGGGRHMLHVGERCLMCAWQRKRAWHGQFHTTSLAEDLVGFCGCA